MMTYAFLVFKLPIQIIDMDFATKWNTPNDNIPHRTFEKKKPNVPYTPLYTDALKKYKSLIGKIDPLLIKLREEEKLSFKNAIEVKRLGKNVDLLACAAEIYRLRLMYQPRVILRSALEQLCSNLERIDFMRLCISNGVCLIGSNFLASVQDSPSLYDNYSMRELGLELDRLTQEKKSPDKVQYTQSNDFTMVLGIFAVVEEIRAVFEERACHMIANDDRAL